MAVSAQSVAAHHESQSQIYRIDPLPQTAYILAMPLHLTPELERRLAQIAARSGRSPDEIAQEALEGYATHLESLIADIREGEESAEREGSLTHEEVFARIEKLLTHKEQLIAAVEEGRAAARRGDLVDHEEVMAMMDSIIENG